ncbi:dimeric dUTPase (all-alpha-NTP-PPase superfamily) [Anoxybacillus tengchongensis]|uniref:Dimeric dUTPase (All-alpha-NTP-PPase superfamily) n=1 Tax=Anoxybacillus tengchongensis TaxID=576944 RepID=A0A7X0DBJ3_9BACL|nr:dUTP diphosphatase [Anoxybacillus tengchongensis]MBB6177214.1 dimeric dUTPase (all-alpha-NTP-PPase superfamily) [Anoxybacillus tengchongensis]
MNLQTLFSMQRQLDERIETERGLSGERLIERKLLALLVEIGELANETRCFKFWSSKPKAADETILEEYVDGLHFILSLGLDLSFDKHIEWPNVQESERLVEQFLHVFEAIHTFRMKLDAEAYNELVYVYAKLGHALQFTAEQIERAYVAKNEVNHERQSHNY